uniref:Uncharacterized protein n=1 Tax=Monopterus albus TaxID=43700 RepID=A0A3Q3Q110_MONAL
MGPGRLTVIVVSLLTNLSVLLCFTQSTELRSHVPGVLILNLSFSNILLTIINIPATFLRVATSAKPFGDLFCQAASLSETFLTTNVRAWTDGYDIYPSCTVHLEGKKRSQLAPYATFTVLFHLGSFVLCLVVLCFAYLNVFHCRRIDVITVQTLLLVDIHPSVKERCLICIFIGSFILCFSPYAITRLVELLLSVHVSQYWGIATKCLSYAKAFSDLFIYCLLWHQYKKVLVSVISRVLTARTTHWTPQMVTVLPGSPEVTVLVFK